MSAAGLRRMPEPGVCFRTDLIRIRRRRSRMREDRPRGWSGSHGGRYPGEMARSPRRGRGRGSPPRGMIHDAADLGDRVDAGLGDRAWGRPSTAAGGRSRRPSATKAADHATVEGDQPERDRRPGGQGTDHLARDDPRRGRSSCPTAGRSSRPGGRRSWATSPCRSRCIPSQPILAILHAGYGEHEVVTVDGAAAAG